MDLFYKIIILCAILAVIYGIYYYRKGLNLHVQYDSEIEAQEKRKEQLKEQIEELFNKRAKLLSDINKEKQKYIENIEKEKNNISEQIKIYKESTTYASEQYFNTLEQEYERTEKEFDEKIQFLNNNIKDAEAQLKELQNSLSAGVQAQLREREKEEKLDFYKLNISANDLDDIKKLESVKLMLYNPVILSKLIWTQYFQKQTTEMCNRIFGVNTICGIYKITDLETKQVYIGQSIHIQDRIKQHCKCGLGIDTPTSNKLYAAMQKDNIWNFTFELLEECPKDELNKKEAYWIAMYKSDKFGFNSNRGVGK